MKKVIMLLVLTTVACGPKDEKKDEVKPDSDLTIFSCFFDEKTTEKLLDDDRYKGHSFCFEPKSNRAQSRASCKEQGGTIGTVCVQSADLVCETEETTTYFYGPNWTKESCG